MIIKMIKNNPLVEYEDRKTDEGYCMLLGEVVTF